MNKLRMIAMCLLAVMAASLSVKAQEVTITLFPGWNWISYPNAVSMEISEALGTFTPMNGDKIKGQFSNSAYNNGYWRGGVTHFMPGMGYMYYSSRSEVTSFVFAATSNSMVLTSTPTDITATTAVVGSTVTIGEGNHIFARGVCWGMEEMPNVEGSHMSVEAVAGSQSITLDGLTPNTTYYVRAYAVTDYGLAYGEEQSFTTLDNSNTGNVPEGAINGLFTINADGDQVYFSKGNLQYQASTGIWQFAENQWDYIGNTNSSISETYNGWIDLFGWGTSGWHDNSDPYNVNYYPYSIATSMVNSINNYYGYGPSLNMPSQNLTGSSSNYDWGVYNQISNGCNISNTWRTLAGGIDSEWHYLFNTRITTSGIRYAKAQIIDVDGNSINGVILLPDNWTTSFYDLSNTNNEHAPYISNVINYTNWANSLESHGAVFLPASGYRIEASVDSVGLSGLYWSTSYHTSDNAHSMHFSNSGLNADDGNSSRYYGFSVRLVCPSTISR